MYSVFVSKTFQKQFIALDMRMQERVRNALKELEKEPFKPRSRADIKPIIGTEPQKHRIRIGNYRMIYFVENNVVKIIEGFWRGTGYYK